MLVRLFMMNLKTTLIVEILYKEIIEKYPNTEYAKQAQVNLGMRVTVKTNEDLAYERFLKAEKSLVSG